MQDLRGSQSRPDVEAGKNVVTWMVYLGGICRHLVVRLDEINELRVRLSGRFNG